MLPRVGVEPFEQLGGRGFLQLDGRDKAENLVPLGGDLLDLDRGVGDEFVAVGRIRFARRQSIEPLPWDIFDPWGKGKT